MLQAKLNELITKRWDGLRMLGIKLENREHKNGIKENNNEEREMAEVYVDFHSKQICRLWKGSGWFSKIMN